MSSQQRALMVAVQNSIGTVETTPDFTVPCDVVTYQDTSQTRTSRDGTGTRVPRTKRNKTTLGYTINVQGDLYYEIIPWFFAGSFTGLASTDGSSPYTYDTSYEDSGDGLIDVTGSEPTIIHYTSWLWSPADSARIGSCFFDTFTFSGNAQSGTLRYDATLNGAEHTQASVSSPVPSGYEIEGIASGVSLGLVHPLDISISTKDAAATGNDFESMTALNCNLLDWSLAFTSPFRPLYAANGSSGTGVYCSKAHRIPSVVFNGVFVTSGATYSAIRQRYLDDTPLELQIAFGPDGDSRAFTLNLTGYWSNVPSAADESDEVIVMNAEFTAENPVIQTSSLHWMEFEIVTDWNFAFNAGDL